MIRVTCFIRPHRLEEVRTALSRLEISGLSVSDVRGSGNSEERPVRFAGSEMTIALPIRSRLEVVAKDELLEPLIEAIVAGARTGEPGDGKIFVEPVEDSIRIRTEERGSDTV
ncbi:MAG: P-II family nitrogen regulator [Armatimonadetes bacterium]|nr:P-II family nitrogen regulator [Armatimonadota bacterium]